MKRAGGGFDTSYNAQSAVDEANRIIIAAELANVGSDAVPRPGRWRPRQSPQRRMHGV